MSATKDKDGCHVQWWEIEGAERLGAEEVEIKESKATEGWSSWRDGGGVVGSAGGCPMMSLWRNSGEASGCGYSPWEQINMRCIYTAREAYGRVHIHITVSNGAGGDVVLHMNTSNTVLPLFNYNPGMVRSFMYHPPTNHFSSVFSLLIPFSGKNWAGGILAVKRKTIGWQGHEYSKWLMLHMLIFDISGFRREIKHF